MMPTMKRGLLLLLFAVLLVGASRSVGSSQPNLVRQIAPGVFYREAERDKRIIANTGWVVFRDYVLVIDANFPWGARAILQDLRKTTDKPIRFVFDTHYHSDHTFGNSVFTGAGATIICSEDCVAESRAKNTPAWARNKETGEYSLQPYRLEHPQIAFRDSMVLDDGTRRVEMTLAGPGHTRGDAVAYLPAERILFTGDLCVNSAGNNIADPDADPGNWVRALDNLARKDITIVVPGHGAQGTAETIRGQRAYLADLIGQVRAGIARGATVDQLEKQIDLSRHRPWGEDPNRNRPAIRAVYAKFSRVHP